MRLAMLAVAPMFVCLAAPASADPATEEAEAEKTDKTEESASEPKKDKRICRYVRTDPSSRRKERICLTAKQWRKANNQR